MYALIPFVVVSLAAYRITRLVTTDTIFSPVRDRLLNRWGNSYATEGFTCPFCMGAWISFALVGSLAQIRSIPLPALYALAVSAVVGIVSHLD